MARYSTGLPLLASLVLSVWASPGAAHPADEQTLAYYSGQVAAQPENQRVYIQRGIAYSNSGQYQLALDDFARATQLGDPSVVDFHIGVVHFRQGDFPAALRHFDQSLAHSPQLATILDYRARTLMELNDTAGASHSMRQFIRLRQNVNAEHYLMLAELLANGPAPARDTAISILDQGIDHLGLIPSLQKTAISLLVSDHQYSEALRRHDTLERSLGNSPQWMSDKADLLAGSGDAAEANRYYRLALATLQNLRKTPNRIELADYLLAKMNQRPH